jgi:hypothetical protein
VAFTADSRRLLVVFLANKFDAGVVVGSLGVDPAPCAYNQSTSIGTSLSSVLPLPTLPRYVSTPVPSPSSPNKLAPQHLMPPLTRAHIALSLPAIAETPVVRPGIGTGVRLFQFVGSQGTGTGGVGRWW